MSNIQGITAEEMSAVWTPEVRALCAGSPLEWARICIKIENKQKDLIHFDPNVLQLRMTEVYETMQEMERPTRMLVLKPRQSGGSTMSTIITVHHCHRHVARAVCMADDYGNSKNLYAMACRHCDTDAFPWGVKNHQARGEIGFSNGSVLEQDTAQNPKAGISATRQVAHLSEVAKYPQDGVRDAYATISNMLASLNKTGANSVAIMETTAESAAGWFYDQWLKAVPLDEWLHGNEGNGWVRVFAAWHEFAEHSREVSPGQEADIMATLSVREKRGIELFGWTVQQIAWRRDTLNTDCGGDEQQFDMHYPEDPLSCFLSSGSPRFNVDGVNALKQLAKAQMTPSHGVLSDSAGAVIWQDRAPNEASLLMFEPPKEGMRYVLAVDCATGARYTKGADPDSHAAFVLRTGYRDEIGRNFPPKIAMALPYPCRIDVDVLGKLVDRMSRFYGRCLIVPERNMGIALIEYLIRKDAPIFVEETIDTITSRSSTVMGWGTTKETKNRVIERLAALIRESTTDSPKIMVDEATADELRTFVRDKNGNCAAQSGCHDDRVMALAIAVTCTESATTYAPIVRRRQKPPDDHRWKEV